MNCKCASEEHLSFFPKFQNCLGIRIIKTIVYGGFVGITENKMETTIVHRGLSWVPQLMDPPTSHSCHGTWLGRGKESTDRAATRLAQAKVLHALSLKP